MAKTSTERLAATEHAMFKSNGIKYEINIMYSDETIYMMTWVYEEDLIEEDIAHEH